VAPANVAPEIMVRSVSCLDAEALVLQPEQLLVGG
jgi:hypothetical protein